MKKSFTTVVFSHGKESGPWGSKITAMAGVVRELGLTAESVDYRGLDDPALRVERLLEAIRGLPEAPVLVGSSMGAHVSAAAAARVTACGLFLLAPAFYVPGYEHLTPAGSGCPTVVIHGWRDDVVPVECGIRWAREQRAALHVLDSGHRLEDRIGEICRLLRQFLLDAAGAS